MKQAVRQGATVAPADMRYIKKPRSGTGDQSQRAGVVSFLGDLYNSVAETLPDVRDDPEPTGPDVKVLDLPVENEEMDPYGDALQLGSASSSSKEKVTKVRTARGSITINTDRRPANGFEERWLPPGQMKDMWEQYKLGLSTSLSRPASFTLFWREPSTHRIRLVFFSASVLFK